MGVKISELTSMGALAGTEKIPGVDSGTQYTTPADLKTYIAPKYAKISDTKSAGTSGGTFTSGAWRTRDLNTEDNDADSIVSISANQFALSAGTYQIRARCPAYAVDTNQARLQNVTDATTTLIGATGYTTNDQCTASEIVGQFTIAGSKTFEIQHQCATTRATDGYGYRANFGISEVYTVVEIWKVA